MTDYVHCVLQACTPGRVATFRHFFISASAGDFFEISPRKIIKPRALRRQISSLRLDVTDICGFFFRHARCYRSVPGIKYCLFISHWFAQRITTKSACKDWVSSYKKLTDTLNRLPSFFTVFLSLFHTKSHTHQSRYICFVRKYEPDNPTSNCLIKHTNKPRKKNL